VVAIRAGKNKGLCDLLAADKDTTADLAFIRASAAGVIVYVLMRGIATRADNGFRDGFPVPAGYWFYRLVISPKVVFKQKLPVLFVEFLDNRQLVGLKLLVIWRIGIIKGKLTQRDIFRDKF